MFVTNLPIISANAPTLLSGAPHTKERLDFSPCAIGKAQLSKLDAKAWEGDYDATWALVELAANACRRIEELFSKGDAKQKRVLTEVAGRRDDFPCLNQAWNYGTTASDSDSMFSALRVGERRGKVKGLKRDALNMELRFCWKPLLETLRSEGADGEMAKREVSHNPGLRDLIEAASQLPALTKKNAGEWARVIVRLMEADGYPIFVDGTWLNQLASPKRVLGKRQERETRALKAKKDMLTEFDFLRRNHRIKARKPTDNDVRTGLREAIKARLQTMFPEVTDSAK